MTWDWKQDCVEKGRGVQRVSKVNVEDTFDWKCVYQTYTIIVHQDLRCNSTLIGFPPPQKLKIMLLSCYFLISNKNSFGTVSCGPCCLETYYVAKIGPETHLPPPLKCWESRWAIVLSVSTLLMTYKSCPRCVPSYVQILLMSPVSESLLSASQLS